ncbi:MAG TPA: 50S ribosomal protein L19e [Candidatus Thermoplasmatota archaeon]|nr:50S ribosomal protein L19e [Candidatus Thermoplasmatota archaeon]
MTDLRNQKALAAKVLAIGGTRVWLDPLHLEDIAEAVTRADIRALVKKGYVKAVQKQGVSRGRARYAAEQKKSGRRRGPGSRKGAKGARNPRKAKWIRTIRPQRRVLAELRAAGKITPAQYRIYYLKAKGGSFRSKAHLVAHMRTDGILPQEVI